MENASIHLKDAPTGPLESRPRTSRPERGRADTTHAGPGRCRGVRPVPVEASSTPARPCGTGPFADRQETYLPRPRPPSRYVASPAATGRPPDQPKRISSQNPIHEIFGFFTYNIRYSPGHSWIRREVAYTMDSPGSFNGLPAVGQPVASRGCNSAQIEAPHLEEKRDPPRFE